MREIALVRDTEIILTSIYLHCNLAHKVILKFRTTVAVTLTIIISVLTSKFINISRFSTTLLCANVNVFRSVSKLTAVW